MNALIYNIDLKTLYSTSKWGLFQGGKAISICKTLCNTSYQQATEGKSDDHINWWGYSVWQNPTLMHGNKNLSKVRTEGNFLDLIGKLYGGKNLTINTVLDETLTVPCLVSGSSHWCSFSLRLLSILREVLGGAARNGSNRYPGRKEEVISIHKVPRIQSKDMARNNNWVQPRVHGTNMPPPKLPLCTLLKTMGKWRFKKKNR